MPPETKTIERSSIFLSSQAFLQYLRQFPYHRQARIFLIIGDDTHVVYVDGHRDAAAARVDDTYVGRETGRVRRILRRPEQYRERPGRCRLCIAVVLVSLSFADASFETSSPFSIISTSVPSVSVSNAQGRTAYSAGRKTPLTHCRRRSFALLSGRKAQANP